MTGDFLRPARQRPAVSRQAAACVGALHRAADALEVVLSTAAIEHAGPPSSHTRSHGVTTLYELYEAPDRRVYEQSRARVQAFACSLRSLPPRDAQSVRTVGYAERTEPAAAWSSHKSAAARLEHNGILPKLFTCPAKHSHVPFNVSYEAQHALRRRGRAFPVWQFAPAGTVTLPHIDLDVNKVPLATYFVVVCGEELIIAWHRSELHEDVVLPWAPLLGLLAF